MAGAHGAKGKLSLKTAQIRIDVWSDYVCPFCYLEQPVLRRIARQYQGKVVLEWRAFELRPEPVPTLDPDCEYLHAIWNRAVYPTPFAKLIEDLSSRAQPPSGAAASPERSVAESKRRSRGISVLVEEHGFSRACLRPRIGALAPGARMRHCALQVY